MEVTVDNGYVSLTHREADVALRLGLSAPDHLVGRRISKARAGVYGSPAYLARHPDPPQLPSLDWVAWEEPWRGVPPEGWLWANVDPSRIRARVNTNFAHTELLASGLGVGFQLRYNGDADPRLRRVGETFDFGLSLWLLTHEDLRQTARINAFMTFVGDALSEERHLITGA